MISSAFAVTVPDMPPPCEREGCGFTPGFWKHNLRVYLGLTNGKYSAFSRDGLYWDAGTKLTDTIMSALIDNINTWNGVAYTYSAQELLDFLNENGWSSNRINTANWFNYMAGYGPF
jgi:hypothetical protein